MTNKLAAMFALLSFITFVGAWLAFRFLNRPVWAPVDMMKMSLIIVVLSYTLGCVFSRLGIQMIQEIIAERRSREETRRLRARELYEQALQPGEEGAEGDEAGTPAEEA